MCNRRRNIRLNINLEGLPSYAEHTMGLFRYCRKYTTLGVSPSKEELVYRILFTIRYPGYILFICCNFLANIPPRLLRLLQGRRDGANKRLDVIIFAYRYDGNSPVSRNFVVI